MTDPGRSDSTGRLNFTDLDRERRQQAFIASLATQLRKVGTLGNPAKLQGILNVARQNIAVDSGLNLLSLARQATNLTSGNVEFVTLPIDHFGTDAAGEDVNVVDVPAIEALVHRLLINGRTATASPTPAGPSNAETATVDVFDATGSPGVGRQLQRALTARGYTAGSIVLDDAQTAHTMVGYPPGQQAAAATPAALLGDAGVGPNSTLPARHLRVDAGADPVIPTAAQAPPSTPSAPTGTTSAAPSAPSALSGGGIPCVK